MPVTTFTVNVTAPILCSTSSELHGYDRTAENRNTKNNIVVLPAVPSPRLTPSCSFPYFSQISYLFLVRITVFGLQSNLRIIY